jgi:putative ribosome biogenesis GTPase RsgA
LGTFVVTFVIAFLTKRDVRADGQLIDCAGFRDFEIWHLDYLEIQNGFVDIARAAKVCVTTCVFTLY